MNREDRRQLKKEFEIAKSSQISEKESLRRARRDGRLQGYEYAMTICMLVLKDKMGFNDFQMRKFFDATESYNKAISTGNMDFRMMQQTLLREYDIKFRIR